MVIQIQHLKIFFLLQVEFKSSQIKTEHLNVYTHVLYVGNYYIMCTLIQMCMFSTYITSTYYYIICNMYIKT